MENTDKTYRVAIIGCGSISANHASALVDAGQHICALCDINVENAEKLKARFSLDDAVIYKDYKQMIETEHPDCVHICTPHYLHAPMIVYALSRDINVLSEKPLCISMEQLEQIRAAARISKAQLGVCQQNRYEGAMLKLKEMADTEGVKAAFGRCMYYIYFLSVSPAVSGSSETMMVKEMPLAAPNLSHHRTKSSICSRVPFSTSL